MIDIGPSRTLRAILGQNTSRQASDTARMPAHRFDNHA